MIKQTAFKLITTLALLASIGGCTIKSKEQTKLAPIAAPSTTKEDKEATKQKQIAYLKEHEQEIVDFVKVPKFQKSHPFRLIGVIFDGAKQATELLKEVAKSSSCMVALIILKILVGMSRLRLLMKCLI